MSAAIVLLAALYAIALATPLALAWLGLLPSHYALVADGLIVLLFALEYASLDDAALRSSGARLVDRDEAPKLHDLVERLAALADLPMPRVAVVDTDVPNAFAAGRDPRRSTVFVTRGLVAELEPAEIEAVLAHELAHVANRDGAVMTIASFPGLSLRYFLRTARPAMWIFGAAIMVVACAGYLVSTGLMLAVSRCREYAADRSAALMTGAPEQLMSALQKIAGRMSAIPREDLRSVASMSAFFILPTNVGSLTHPPLRRRLDRLEELARELGRPVMPPGPELAGPSVRSNVLLGAVTFLAAFVAIVVVGTALW
jgi:heat shock protein HtpX